MQSINLDKIAVAMNRKGKVFSTDRIGQTEKINFEDYLTPYIKMLVYDGAWI